MLSFRTEAVLFDFNGRLTQPGAIDFETAKEALRCPSDTYLLEFVAGLPEGAERERARAALERFELDGAARSEPNEGAEAIVQRLRQLRLPFGILTRNGRAAVERGLECFAQIGPADFERHRHARQRRAAQAGSRRHPPGRPAARRARGTRARRG